MVTFKSDIGKRKKLFTPEAFGHPAKMHLGMFLWIMGKYTKPGDTILDPMAGSGSTMLAASYGRNVVLVELEEKFVDMAKANWDKIKTLPKTKYEFGDCQILQGDARNLEGLMADNIITSPPYAGAKQVIDKAFYAKALMDLEGRDVSRELAGLRTGEDSIDSITNLPYGQIDTVITSPPYEGSLQGDVEDKISSGFNSPKAVAMIKGQARGYSKEADNIGNLRADTYLSAMSQVYQQCYNVLKPGGLMILVTKDFIRNKQRVYLSLDTMKLCAEVGFKSLAWHERKLTQQSFWRILYNKKYPDADKLDTEDILIFQKPDGEETLR